MANKIIEIIGPPGIGKSTIYKALCNTWKPDLDWTYQNALLLDDKPVFSNLKIWMEYNLKKLLGKKLTRHIPSEFGMRFIDNNPELAKFYWKHLSDSRTYSDKMIARRFRSAHLLFNDFCRYQAVLEKEGDTPCLINEGLLQKSFFINEDENYTQDLLKTYLSLLPMPQAIVYIDTPNIKVILNRLQNRKKVIASHLGKTDQALYNDIEQWKKVMNTIVESSQGYNVSIIKVDGEKSITENIVHIREMLKNNVAPIVTTSSTLTNKS